MTDPHSNPEDDAAEDAIAAMVASATDDFMQRASDGAEPSIEEHVRRYPQIGGILRELLPAMRIMRQADQSGAETLGCLGDFRLVRQIGRGGMGVVYEAEQISLRRRVALKVLPLAAALDPRQLERFRLEAQAAAHLHHSNIVPIYSVGCERGVYYYAMQFIEGRSLADVIGLLSPALARADSLGQSDQSAAGQGVVSRRAPATDDPAEGAAAGSSALFSSGCSNGERGADHRCTTVPAPRSAAPGEAAGAGDLRPPLAINGMETVADARGVDTTAWTTSGDAHFGRVATLGAQAAEALEHAHSMGVIHRDIKPANLLLDTRGAIYVADFGLARLQGASGLTQTGGLAGTLRYMSPEQVAGQRGVVDHRTDIYSLGVTLYELLTLSPAFDANDRPALLQQIIHDEPAPPRQCNKSIPVDLETIVLKAMAKEPASRYASAQQMAEDLRRFLEHRPVLARRPTVWERAVKWTRRHRGVAAAALVTITLCAIGFAVSTALVLREQWRTRQAYDKAQSAWQSEAKQRARAEQSLRQARKVVDFVTEVSEGELADKPELAGVRRMMLAAALDYYREFIEMSQDDPSLTAELVASHVRVGAILDEIGSQADALAALQRARDLQEKLLRKDPMMPELQRGFFSIYSRLDLLRGGRDLQLLRQRAVRDDLKLTPEQVAKVDELSDRRRANLSDPRRLTAEQWRERFEQLDLQQREVAGVLLSNQAARLTQISLQQRGNDAFTDPEVAAALQLTPQQLQAIRSLREESRRMMWGALHSGEGRPGEARGDQWKKAREASRKISEQIVAALTPQQQAQWQQLIGTPFRGRLMMHPGGWRSWPGPPKDTGPDGETPPPFPGEESP